MLSSQIKRQYEKVKDSKRQGLIALVLDQGLSIKDVVVALGISYSSARSVMYKYNSSGCINRSKKGGSKYKLLLFP